MSDGEPKPVRSGPAPSLFLYAAACAVLLLGIIGAASIDPEPKCPSGSYPSAQSCISYGVGAPGGGAVTTQSAPAGRDWKLAIRAELLLSSGAVALVLAYFAARAYRRERAVVV